MSSKKNGYFNMEEFEKKLKSTNSSAGVLLHLAHASNDRVYEAAEDLVNTRKKFLQSKIKLNEINNEVEQLRNEVNCKKNNLQAVTTALRKAMADLQTLDVRTLSKQEALILKMDSWLIEEDVIQAWKHISYAEEDLKEDSSINGNVTNKSSGSILTNNDIKVMNTVSIPNVISNGIVSLNGSININRNKCCICLERKIDSVLYKCGHMCMCFSCASELMRISKDSRKCPVCRSNIFDVIKTYFS